MKGYFHTSSTKNYLAILARILSGIKVAKPRVIDGRVRLVAKKVPVYIAHAKEYVKSRNSINNPTGSQNIAKVHSIVPQININILDTVPNMLYNTAKNVFYETYDADGIYDRQYSPAPQTIIFEVNLKGGTFSEAFEMEQMIVPYFKPNYVVTIEEMYGKKLSIERDISFTMQTKMTTYDKDVNEISLVLECVAYDYPPQMGDIGDDDIIRTIYVDYTGNRYAITEKEMSELLDGDETLIQHVNEEYITEEDWDVAGNPIERKLIIKGNDDGG